MKAIIWNKSWFCNLWADYKTMCSDLEKMALTSGFGVVGFSEYHFKPFGYSAVFLLAESHLAVHTFDEEKKVYVELSSCNQEFYNNFLALFENSKGENK